MLVQLESTLAQSPDEAAAACTALIEEAEHLEHLAVGMRARVLSVRHRTEAGTVAQHDVEDLVERLRRLHPADTYFAEAWWIASCAFDALSRADAADAALREGFDWIAGRALPQVPPEFRDSFLNRNPVNRDLLAAAARRLGLRVPAPPITPR